MILLNDFWMISYEVITKSVFFKKKRLFSQIVVFLQPLIPLAPLEGGRKATLAQLVEQRIRNA